MHATDHGPIRFRALPRSLYGSLELAWQLMREGAGAVTVGTSVFQNDVAGVVAVYTNRLALDQGTVPRPAAADAVLSKPPSGSVLPLGDDCCAPSIHRLEKAAASRV